MGAVIIVIKKKDLISQNLLIKKFQLA